jgi:diaminopimelate epimerase
VKLEIVKAHGASNDFVMIEDLDDEIDLDDSTVEGLCDRRRGVGADGVIRVVSASGTRVFMDHRNADGSRPEMCGNGIRCFAKFCFDRGILTGNTAVVDTRSGPRSVVVHHDASGKVRQVAVDMGPATFAPQKVPVEADPGTDHIDVHITGPVTPAYFAGMGNPHAVVFVDDPDATAVESWGRAIETDSRFPSGANVEFVTVENASTVRARVWERGVGETQACGTGACAVAAVSHRLGLAGSEIDVRLPGGALHIAVGDTVTMTGPAVEVFTAAVDTRFLRT